MNEWKQHLKVIKRQFHSYVIILKFSYLRLVFSWSFELVNSTDISEDSLKTISQEYFVLKIAFKMKKGFS